MTFFYWARYPFLAALVALVLLFMWWSADADAHGS
jgi:hypothetical protein